MKSYISLIVGLVFLVGLSPRLTIAEELSKGQYHLGISFSTVTPTLYLTSTGTMTFSLSSASTFYFGGSVLWAQHSITTPPFETPEMACFTNSHTGTLSEVFHTADPKTCLDNNEIYKLFSTVMKGENSVLVWENPFFTDAHGGNTATFCADWSDENGFFQLMVYKDAKQVPKECFVTDLRLSPA